MPPKSVLPHIPVTGGHAVRVLQLRLQALACQFQVLFLRDKPLLPEAAGLMLVPWAVNQSLLGAPTSGHWCFPPVPERRGSQHLWVLYGGFGLLPHWPRLLMHPPPTHCPELPRAPPPCCQACEDQAEGWNKGELSTSHSLHPSPQGGVCWCSPLTRAHRLACGTVPGMHKCPQASLSLS